MERSKYMAFADRLLRGLLAGLVIVQTLGAGAAAAQQRGEDVYNKVCIGCHLMGIVGAPKAQDVAAWRERYKKGEETLIHNALNGIGKMPPRGGNPTITPDDIRAAIRYMAGDAARSPVQANSGAGKEKTSAAGAEQPVAESSPARTDAGIGKKIVERVCKGCHELGVLNAPRIGAAADWKPRLGKGLETLLESALNGIGNMPPKGGDASLTKEDLRVAIQYMSAPSASAKATSAGGAEKAASDGGKAAAEPAPTPKRVTLTGVNRFNRLMTPPAERNRPPALDGIHDPNNPGTMALQAPREAFITLPKGQSGNYVDWVKALQEALIAPRFDRLDPSKKPMIMDLNIVREVKGSMPDVVYPHKAHLEWLDCSNCHPAIFEPKKGANSISMAEIILGKKCGVCHGKVAFPVAECRRCHSRKKPPVAVTRN